MKTKKVPMRSCIMSKEQLPKQELIRIVKNKEGQVCVDLTGKMNGRGAYICDNVDCLEKAIKTKRLEKIFETKISEEIYENLRGVIVEK